MRSRRFSRRSSQKIVVNGVRVDAAYLRQQAERKAAEKEALRRKRVAVRRKPKPRPSPKLVVEVIEAVPEPEPEVVPEAVVEEASSDTGDVKEAE